MKKCPNCGDLYDDKNIFCSQCGSKLCDEKEDTNDLIKICPVCGIEYDNDAVFCGKCGSGLIEGSVKNCVKDWPEQNENSDLKPIDQYKENNGTYNHGIGGTAAKILNILPRILFYIFSLSSFLFLATPIAEVNSFWLPDTHIGNAYEALKLNEAHGLQISIIILMFFCCVSLISSLFFLIRKKKVSYNLFNDIMCVGCYVGCIIASIFIINEIKNADEGMGLIKSGACPILFIVVPAILLVITIGCLLLKKYLPMKQVDEPKKEKNLRPRLKRLNIKKLIGCIVGILTMAMVLVIIFVFVIPEVTNIFKVSKVKAISIGATKEEVISILGEPFEDTKTEDQWEYYDKELLSYVEKYNKLLKDQEKALMEGDFDKLGKLEKDIKELSQKVNSKSFDYIRITFDGEKVKSVYLDCAYKNTYEEKQVGDISLLDVKLNESKNIYSYIDHTQNGKVILYDNEYTNINVKMQYEVFFVDGSYYKTYDNMVANINVNNSTVNWSDRYGSYTTTFDLGKLNTNKIGEISKSGVWTSSKNNLNLSEFVFPDNVKAIGNKAFEDCSSLQRVLFNGESQLQSIGNSAFSGCCSITSINIPSSVTSIGSRAFSGCTNLQSVTFEGESQLQSIGEYAFFNCSSITSIEIPNKVTNIGNSAFYSCPIEEATIPTYAIDSIPKSNLKKVIITCGDSIGRNAFSGCSSLQSVEIPDSVTSIGDDAFSGCDNLQYNAYNNAKYLGNKDNQFLVLIKAISVDITECMIPESTKFILGVAFAECTNLQSVTFEGESQLQSIGRDAFYNCESLTSIEIPNNVTSIGGSVFNRIRDTAKNQKILLKQSLSRA